MDVFGKGPKMNFFGDLNRAIRSRQKAVISSSLAVLRDPEASGGAFASKVRIPDILPTFSKQKEGNPASDRIPPRRSDGAECGAYALARAKFSATCAQLTVFHHASM